MKEEKTKIVKEKKIIIPNECSVIRWIIAVALGFFIGFILGLPVNHNPYADNTVDTFMGITYETLFSVLYFIPLFIGLILALKLVAKTSLKDFILGVGGKIKKKECLLILGLYALGIAISILSIIKYVSVRHVNPGHYAFLVLFMLLTVCIQTTFEELLFRGIFLRWACKNKIGYTKKAWIVAGISSVMFALIHTGNPEVIAQDSWWKIAIALLVYTLPGFVYIWADMHFGSLLPGVIMHWLNNFVLCTLISEEATVVSTPTLLIDGSSGGSPNAVLAFASTVMICAPVVIYMIMDIIRKKKAVAAAK